MKMKSTGEMLLCFTILIMRMFPTAEEHPFKGSEILKEKGFSEDFRKAILSHADYSGVP